MFELDDLMSQQIDLPSAPAVVSQLTTLMAKEDVSSHEIAGIVATDQAFAARTLKLVNSPFYGFARQITSVKEAVMMLGVSSLQQLLLTTSVISSFECSSGALSIDEFWMHSFSVGVLAKHLLGADKPDDQNEAFMCGVLHDIGRLLYVKADSERYAKFYDAGSSVIDLEKEAEWYGKDHQQAGRMLGEKWNFPAPFIQAISLHHNPDQAEDNHKLVSAIHLADLVCHALNLGSSGNEFVSRFSPSTWTLLELDGEKLETVIVGALEEIRKTESMIRNIH